MIWPADFALMMVDLLSPSSDKMAGIIVILSIAAYFAMIASPLIAVVGFITQRKENQE